MVGSLEYIALVAITLSTILAILIIFKYKTLYYPLKVVGIFIIVSTAIDIISTAFYYEQENNMRFLHLFTLFEFVIISHLFNILFSKLKNNVNILYTSIPITFFIIFNTLLFQNIDELNSYSSALSSIAIVAYCIYYFFILLAVQIKNFQFVVLKWFIICLFIYHSTSIIVMLFGGLILNISREAVSYIWAFRSLVILSTKIILSYYFVKLFFFNRNLKAS